MNKGFAGRSGPESESASEPAAVVAQLWAELFQLDAARADDHFLDLGGDSLMAKRLLVRIEARLGCKVPFRTILDAPTLGQLTKRVEELCGAR